MKYIFWDFNGTILDDLELCLDILNEMLIEENRKTVTLKEYLDIFEFPVKNYYAKVFDFNIKSFDVLAKTFMDKYQPRSLSLKLHKHVLEAINYFKEKGYKNVLLSASQIDNLIEQTNHYGITNYFDDILGTNNIHGKSKIDVARLYISENNIDSKDMTFIGDSLHDVEIAKEFNAKIIVYSKGHQSKDRFKDVLVIDDFLELML